MKKGSDNFSGDKKSLVNGILIAGLYEELNPQPDKTVEDGGGTTKEKVITPVPEVVKQKENLLAIIYNGTVSVFKDGMKGLVESLIGASKREEEGIKKSTREKIGDVLDSLQEETEFGLG
jgi:hypothetical protein